MTDFLRIPGMLLTLYVSGIFVHFTLWYLWYTLIHIGRDGYRPMDKSGDIAFNMGASLVWPLPVAIRLLVWLADRFQYRRKPYDD